MRGPKRRRGKHLKGDVNWRLQLPAQREKETAVVEQYVVSGTSLITCSAGFNIQHVIPGFDLCHIVIKNLPKKCQMRNVHPAGYQWLRILDFPGEGDRKQTRGDRTCKCKTQGAISLSLNGVTFRDEILSFSISDNASGNAVRTAGQNIPFITVFWRIPVETIIANCHSMEKARSKVRELDNIWKGR